jgi:hypothetical protein
MDINVNENRVSSSDSSSNMGVWPPAPTAPVEVVVPYRVEQIVLEGALSDFRSGTIKVNPEGFTLLARRVPNAETQAKVLGIVLGVNLLTCFYSWELIFLSVFLLPIAAGIMESLSVSREIIVPWSEVKAISATSSRKICIAYFESSNDVARLFTLSMRLKRELYEYLLAGIQGVSGKDITSQAGRVATPVIVILAASPMIAMMLLGLLVPLIASFIH